MYQRIAVLLDLVRDLLHSGLIITVPENDGTASLFAVMDLLLRRISRHDRIGLDAEHFSDISAGCRMVA